jgi:uncharacterized protein (TIGR02001 family)
MRFFRSFLAIAFLPATTLAQQDPPYSIGANIAITTDYVFRGVSRTRTGPALQFGVDGSYTLGPIDLFVGAWASNVDLGGFEQVATEGVDTGDGEETGNENDETDVDGEEGGDETDIDGEEGGDETDVDGEEGDDETDVDGEEGDDETGDGDGDGEQVELDFFVGVNGELPLGAGLDWDAGVVYYAFPWVNNSSDFDFIEAFFGLSYTFIDQVLEPEVGVRVYYSPDYAAGSGQDIYTEGSTGFSLPYDVDLDLHMGYQMASDGAPFGLPAYFDWRIGLSREIALLDFALSYVDTDLSKEECFGGRNLCEARAVFTVSMEF